MSKKPFLTLLSTAALSAVAALSVPVTATVAAPNAESKAAEKVRYHSRAFIVRLAEQPVVQYDGGIKGLAATRPGRGQKIDPDSSKVTAYMGFLASRHDEVLAKVGGGKKLYSYGFAFNGFAAELSEEQAAKLAQVPGVLAVQRNELLQLDTATTPKFLGLTDTGGLWDQLGGVGSAGENIIIGVVDGGIWPELLSYSDRTGVNGNATKDGKLSYQQIPGWHGRCVPGEAFNASNCNQKLIGARFYNEGYGGNAGIDEIAPWEFNSPRDYSGHGTHTSTTAGGNNGVDLPAPLNVYGKVSGIAPHARIAAYKACWLIDPTTSGSCPTVDTLAAIDQAVADGVDVINYSISGSQTNFRDAVEIAFLSAADAGIFVAASAGNSGPGSSTVAHPSPWVTTVAASSHDRFRQAMVTLGNGATYSGASTAATSVAAPLVLATASGLGSADANLVRQCTLGTLDPAKVAGKIVVCERGGAGPNNARVDKSLEVANKGGVGMVLYNVAASTLNGDFHSVPTVHVDNVVGPSIAAYAANPDATATIGASYTSSVVAPTMASFSSRGPLRASADLLKPDVTAPGVDIIAGVAPPGNGGASFASYQGTSMSSPHVAGLAALLKDLHPDWSPMAIKSALMTTAYQTMTNGATITSGNVFSFGAGHVKPNSAADPGLVYDSNYADWLGFLCGTQLPTSFCSSAGVPVLDPSDFNSPSISIAELAGSQTIKRRVTNVSGKPLTVNAAVVMNGFATVVTPSSLTLKPGETKSFTVQFSTNAGTALNTYFQGALTWTGGGYTVRSPIVMRAVALAAPATVTASVGGSAFPVTFGYTGSFSATARGLVPAALTSGTVADDPTDGACSLTAPNAVLIPVDVAAGTSYARFSLFDADVAAGADIDLCVFRGAALVGSSGSGTSAEEVNLTDPIAATYTVVVQGWGVAGSSPFKLHTWLLDTTAAGNMVVDAPTSATLGTTAFIGLGFTGLTAGTKYLGSVAYAGAAGLPAPTIVRVDP